MALHNVYNQDTTLGSSYDAKPRLKWTPELHQRFVEAVNQLGGADKATPKSLVRMLGIHGLTLQHLKSHLQKYRMGKNQQSQSRKVNIHEEARNQDDHHNGNPSVVNQGQINEYLQMAKALQMQIEVQRKLHEQIEVQKRLQLRIEAQGKYLQTVLLRAQETLSQYRCSSIIRSELEKTELFQFVSMVETGYQSYSPSEVTDIGDSFSNNSEKKPSKRRGHSFESCLTSSDSSERHEAQPQYKANVINGNSTTVHLSSTSFVDDCVDHPSCKRLCTEREPRHDQSRNFKLIDALDLNIQRLNDSDSCTQGIDLNLEEPEEFN